MWAQREYEQENGRNGNLRGVVLCRDTGKETGGGGGVFREKENVQAFGLQGFGFRVLTVSSSFCTRLRL